MSDRMRHLNDISPVIYSDKCVTAKKSSSLIHELTRVNDEEQKVRERKDEFVHEPEEQSALFDSTIYLQALLPQLENKMATKTAEFEKNDTLSAVGVDTTALRSLTAEDDTDSKIKPTRQSFADTVHNKQEMNANSGKNKYPTTDADVISDISSYSNECDSGFVSMNKSFSPRKSIFGVTKNIHQQGFYYDDNSAEYWSDEDYRYPPQMSLSPPPGQLTFRKKPLKEKKSEEKPHRRIPEKHKETKQSEDFSKILLKKRPLARTLSPIGSKSEHHHHQNILSLTERTSLNASPFFIKTTESVSPTRTLHPYGWKPKDAIDELLISSAASQSLIQPTLSLTPTSRKEKYPNNSNSSCLTYSYRMKNDNIFDSQRCTMPKKRVSRSQSSTTATTSTLFPEIPTISKTQATSKSISDFRQSSSIFGKFAKKNCFKETLDDRREGKLDKQDKESSQAKGSSRNRTCESTKRKIRRILSLN